MPNSFTLFLNKIGFWGKRHSPELLVAGAILSGAAAIGTAIYSTTKLNKTLKPFNDKIDVIRKQLKLKDGEEFKDPETPKKLKKELTKTYAHAALKVFNLYLPSVALFGASCSCTLGSHHIQKNRTLALSAAYATLEKGYSAYREKVKAKLGEETEKKLYENVYKEKVEEIDPKTGKTKTVTKELPHKDDSQVYDIWFTCGCRGWTPDALYNYEHLLSIQAELNEMLKRKGYVFLSDVYDYLGVDFSTISKEKVRASRILGWVYDPKDSEHDNYISFGITHPGTGVATKRVAEQLEGNFHDFLLTFNVDGDILNRGTSGKKKFYDVAKW